MNHKTILNALRKAKYHYRKGLRYYDTKHNTYNPAWYSDNILQHVSDLIGYYGLEASYDPTNATRPNYSYVNSGDSYGLTLVYNHQTGKFRITDIGSIIERYS